MWRYLDHESTFGSVHGRRGLLGSRMDPGYLVDFVSGRVRELTVVQFFFINDVIKKKEISKILVRLVYYSERWNSSEFSYLFLVTSISIPTRVDCGSHDKIAFQ